MVSQWRVFILLLLCFSLCSTHVFAATVTAVADRDRITEGESLQLQLRVDGSPDGEPDLSPLEKNWEILNRSQSSQMQIVNGSFSRSVVYALTLMPRSKGTLVIPEVCFAKDCSLPMPIEVSGSAAQTTGVEEVLLLETEVTPQKIVTQGQLLFTVRLMRRVDLLDGQLNEPQPTGVSAVVKKLGDDRSYESRRNGRLYQVIERTYAIFPQGVGQMIIPAMQFDGSIAPRRTRMDPYGQQRRRVRRTSQPLQVEVSPLPKDIGRRSWIPALAVDLRDDWQQHPPKLTVGEPVTRTLHLGASGVQSAQLPELKPEVPESFKTYPDQPKREDLQSSSGISGVLEQKIAMVPTRAGHFTLPAVDLDWWDVSARRWRSAHLAALELEVAAAPDAVLTSLYLPKTPPAPNSVDAETAAGNPFSDVTTDASPAVIQTVPGFWPWLSLGLVIGWLLTLFMFWRLWRRDRTGFVQPVVDLKPTEKVARKAVIMAAQNNDPQATRQALLAWSRTLWPEAQTGAYEQLCSAVDPELCDELENLDLFLYGHTDNMWEGSRLAEKLAHWRPADTNGTDTQLPPLYPEGPSRP
jgi:hypothetical protein